MVHTVYLGESPLQAPPDGGAGRVLQRDGETVYCIENFHVMPPFFMSVVSAYDHWMFVSSTGGLTCGRRSPDHALFPYTTDDKVHDAASNTGPLTLMLVDDGRRTRLWKPFCLETSVYPLTRNLYKNREGNRLVFEEINHGLGLTYAYTWTTGERFGFIRKATLRNHGGTAIEVRLVDGFRNLLPAGVDRAMQTSKSTLVDAYKQAEAVSGCTAALFSLSSLVTDRAEPSEALNATVAWSLGLDRPGVLLTEEQLSAFRHGAPLRAERRSRGKRSAFLVFDRLTLAQEETRTWYIAADVEQGPVAVPGLLKNLEFSLKPADIEEDIRAGTRRLRRLVGAADGFQAGADPLVTGRHFSNVLFNVMRGGVFDRSYSIPTADFLEFVADRRRSLRDNAARLFSAPDDRLSLGELVSRAGKDGDPDLRRLVLEYLPLTFSRRHGDPSRPWNHFTIEVRNPDGGNDLSYQGNWRDIFQNWEALAWSFPEFIENVIAIFVNASTPDGHNAYRISRDGFDWEVLDPMDPWSNIGYWGDHQVGYLHRLLEFSRHVHPGRLESLLNDEIFVYADIPYRLKGLRAQLDNPRNTVEYDENQARVIGERVARIGIDGKLVIGPGEDVVRVNLLEKLLVPALAKLGQLVPEGGIWMNTQRPEWNDANNALVGYGLSVVTLCYLRRYLSLLADLLSTTSAERFTVTGELADVFSEVHSILKAREPWLERDLEGRERMQFMTAAGVVMESWREKVYAGFSGLKSSLGRDRVIGFIRLALRWVDHGLAANEREDGLWHAYNLLRLQPDRVELDRLDVMLEGQVAMLFSGYLQPAQALSLLRKLRASVLYQRNVGSYLLYPDRQLPGFMEKNRVPADLIDNCAWAKDELENGSGNYLVQDALGQVHFRGRYRNASVLAEALAGDPDIGAESAAWLMETYERVFRHQRFTGRSGSMYKYEGLGCIYWHMVSKLALAAAEATMDAIADGAPEEVVDGLAECCREIREGLGLHKSPADYGAFTTDPYSHSPGFAGVQQPGLTGQVKEDVIARFTQLGIVVRDGRIRFSPALLEDNEFLDEPSAWNLVRDGQPITLELPAGSLGFTLCSVPVVYRKANESRLVIQDAGGIEHSVESNVLSEEWSRKLFARNGSIARITVFVPAKDLR